MNLHDAIEKSTVDTAEIQGIGFRIRVIWNEGKYRVEYQNNNTNMISGHTTELTHRQLRHELKDYYFYVENWEPYE